MVIFGILLLSFSIAAMAVSLGLIAIPDKAIRTRLLERERIDLPPATGRLIRQIDSPSGASRHVVSKGMRGRIERNLMLAGHPSGWTMKNILLAKIAVPLVMLLLISNFAFVGASPFRFSVGLIVLAVSYFTPDLLVHSRGKERQDEMQLQLPDFLDKIVITIEAGLGFESALARTAATGSGPLAEEFVRTVQDIRLGVSRREAYEDLQRRTTSEDIHSFIRGVIQAEEHGSSISGMVRIQSREMRIKRKLRAEAKAGQVAVKMLGPLMVCIFPVLFIVVLAPGIMNAINTLQGP